MHAECEFYYCNRFIFLTFVSRHKFIWQVPYPSSYLIKYYERIFSNNFRVLCSDFDPDYFCICLESLLKLKFTL